MKKLYFSAIFYGFITIVYEFFNKQTTKVDVLYRLSSANPTHIYVLVLGMVLFLLALVLTKSLNLDRLKSFNSWLILFDSSAFSLLSMIVISDHLESKNLFFSKYDILISSLHGLLLISVVWFVFLVEKSLKLTYKQNTKS